MNKMKSNAIPWWGWIVWLLIAIFGVLVYRHLPNQIATHFNANGQPNSFSSRLKGIITVPLIMLAIMILWQFVWRIDPKRKNYASFWSTYRTVGGIVVLCLGAVQFWVLTYALQSEWASARILPTVIGVILLLLANVLPRLQSNWVVGIRTPWSLSSEESWRKTHRLAGNLGVPMGIIIVVLAWILPTSMIKWGLLSPIVIWALVTVIASYIYARNESL
ncbi:SdpI family protein [Alicyclobacillus fastidiosus]|uniref:SdpI family protein n=1 Tax=Alicyclobacillus fastidiosus TaxID=392011 RepID=A0ABY6ZIH2_9BACL|nr:SdpI family protein [Alicyclobacillus fastidiosus]WAH42307.1 SdpI family protein [Alicyclobacillus fastidiosus]GMA64116.1 hypothetical protein GCM10025859_45560 [Alicyclobacillus fastidiosus]